MSRDSMVFAVKPWSDKMIYTAEQSEMILQNLFRHGSDWDYPNCDCGELLSAYKELGKELDKRFDAELETFAAENGTALQIRAQRAANHWDRLIQQSEKAIATMKMSGRKESLIRGRETRLKNDQEKKSQKLLELERRSKIDFEGAPLAAGVFRVMATTK